MADRVVLYQLIGERIEKRRKALKITQEQLSKAAKISRSTISNIEAGKHSIPIDILYIISEKLETEVHILLPTELTVREKMSETDIESKLERKNISREDIELIKSTL